MQRIVKQLTFFLQKNKSPASAETEEEDEVEEEEEVFNKIKLSNFIKASARYYPGKKFSLRKNLKKPVKDKMLYRSIKENVKRKQKQIDKKITDLFGCAEPVTIRYQNNKKRYFVRCYECNFESRSLESHMIRVHKKSAKEAKEKVSSTIKIFNHETKLIKGGSYRPYKCEKCNRFVGRLDTHLVNFHSLNRQTKEFEEIIVRAKNGSNDDQTGDKRQAQSTSDKKQVYKYQVLTAGQRRRFALDKDSFRYFYSDSTTLLGDFEFYLQTSLSKSKKSAKQIVQSLTLIWNVIDPEKSVLPNMLAYPEKLEDDFVIPRVEIIKKQELLPIEKQIAHMKPNTLLSKLNSINELINFSKVRFVYVGLTFKDMDLLCLKVKELNKMLKPYRLKRDQTLKDWKSDTLITPAHLLEYGNSIHVQECIKLLDDIQVQRINVKDLNMKKLTDIRNYLLVNLSVTNAARASNLINITIQHVEDAKFNEEFGAFTFKSSKYKTSMIYGSKEMVVPEDLFKSIQIYVEKIHPIISGKDCNYLFSSSRNRSNSDSRDAMDHSLISNSMTKSFLSAGVKIIGERVSPSSLRCAVVTDLVGMEGENCDNIAQFFMKHRPETSRKFYINNWAKQESLRIAMKCYSRFITNPDLEKVSKERNEMMKCPPPTLNKIKNWLKENNIDDDKIVQVLKEGETIQNSEASDDENNEESGINDNEVDGNDSENDSEKKIDFQTDVAKAYFTANNGKNIAIYDPLPDDLHALSNKEMKRIQNIASQACVDDAQTFWHQHKSKFDLLLGGHIYSYRKDVLHGKVVLQLNGNVIRPYDLQFHKSTGGLSEEVLDFFHDELEGTYKLETANDVKIICDVMDPLAVQWFMQIIAEITAQEAIYYFQNWDSIEERSTESEEEGEEKEQVSLKKKKRISKLPDKKEQLPDSLSAIPSSSDWYVSRKRKDSTSTLSRKQILSIVFVGKYIIRQPEGGIQKASFMEAISEAKISGFKAASTIENVPWPQLKDVLKNMKNKYLTKPESHESFNEFLALARTLWRLEL